MGDTRHCNIQANAKVLRRAGIEGEKKYSPPFGTTHSAGSASVALWFFGSVPDRLRVPLPFWPMIASKPGSIGFWIGKPVLFAQPARGSATFGQLYKLPKRTMLNELEAIRDTSRVCSEDETTGVGH